LANQLVLAPRIAAADQRSHAASEHLVLEVAGNVAEGLVDRQQQIVGIEHDDALAGRLEHRRGETLLLLATLALGDVTAGAEHAYHLALLVPLDGPATVLDPQPVAVGVLHPVFHAIAI